MATKTPQQAVPEDDAASESSFPSSAAAMHAQAMRADWIQKLASSGDSIAKIKEELDVDSSKSAVELDKRTTEACQQDTSTHHMHTSHRSQTYLPHPCKHQEAAVVMAGSATSDCGTLVSASTSEKRKRVESQEEYEERKAYMRYLRMGAKMLTGEAAVKFSEKRSDGRKALFDLYIQKGENWDAVNVSYNQQVRSEEVNRSTGLRAWKNREWILANKYSGNQDKTDRCIQEKERIGQARLDPDGSGDMEYLILLEDTVASERSNGTLSTLNASAKVDPSAAAAFMGTMQGNGRHSVVAALMDPPPPSLVH